MIRSPETIIAGSEATKVHNTLDSRKSWGQRRRIDVSTENHEGRALFDVLYADVDLGTEDDRKRARLIFGTGWDEGYVAALKMAHRDLDAINESIRKIREAAVEKGGGS